MDINGRCYLVAVLSEDGRKVERIFVSTGGPYSGLSPSDISFLDRFSYEHGSRVLKMCCGLDDTAITNSARRMREYEQYLRAHAMSDKQKWLERDLAKTRRWISKRREGGLG